jgi:hypothetical protein
MSAATLNPQRGFFMKNKFTLFGIIALVVIIGFGFIACGSNEKVQKVYIKVINQHAETITKVEAFHPDGWLIDDAADVNIITGSEATVTVRDIDEGLGFLNFKKGNCNIRVTTENNTKATVNKAIKAEQTVTVTFKADGTLE